jgi:hypothetical protein
VQASSGLHFRRAGNVRLSSSSKHMKGLIEDAGGTIDDIARVTFLVRSKAAHRPLIDEEGNAMFASGSVQPARLVIEVPPQGRPSIQCEFIGMLATEANVAPLKF